jgi:hypothetical protein
MPPADTGAQSALGTLKMEFAPFVLIAFSAGVYVGVLVLAMMFVVAAKDDADPRGGISG